MKEKLIARGVSQDTASALISCIEEIRFIRFSSVATGTDSMKTALDSIKKVIHNVNSECIK